MLAGAFVKGNWMLVIVVLAYSISKQEQLTAADVEARLVEEFPHSSFAHFQISSFLTLCEPIICA